jgi:transmembrane sensor
MKKEELYKQLIDRYLEGTASLEEVEVFFHLLNKGELDGLLAPGQVAPVRRFGSWKKYGAAAAVILLVGAGIFLLQRPRSTMPANVAVTNVFKNDVAPGGKKAVLTLGDGRTVVLDSAAKGNVASQGNTTIVKTDAGQLAYNAGGNTAAPVLSNTLSTPAGGQYQVTLADGTKVWLNALSKLEFPSAFRGRDSRSVKLSGEAYFEVMADKDRPFVVMVNGVSVRVLGTHFNVNGYTDEPEIRTTLLEGAVNMAKGADVLPLKPGQQGLWTGNRLSVRTADIDQVMAWKNGAFSWDAADVFTVMRQISRWYGVEVKYEGRPTQALFGGEIGRDLSLTQVLTGLSKSKVHFRLEGKILTVLP